MLQHQDSYLIALFLISQLYIFCILHVQICICLFSFYLSIFVSYWIWIPTCEVNVPDDFHELLDRPLRVQVLDVWLLVPEQLVSMLPVSAGVVSPFLSYVTIDDYSKSIHLQSSVYCTLWTFTVLFSFLFRLFNISLSQQYEMTFHWSEFQNSVGKVISLLCCKNFNSDPWKYKSTLALLSFCSFNVSSHNKIYHFVNVCVCVSVFKSLCFRRWFIQLIQCSPKSSKIFVLLYKLVEGESVEPDGVVDVAAVLVDLPLTQLKRRRRRPGQRQRQIKIFLFTFFAIVCIASSKDLAMRNYFVAATGRTKDTLDTWDMSIWVKNYLGDDGRYVIVMSSNRKLIAYEFYQ